MGYSQPKSAQEIAIMRQGGRILAQIFQDLRSFVEPGQTEKQIDAWVEQEIRRHGATPTYKEPAVSFPGVICISKNQQVVHSVPTDEILEAGDIIGFDLVITYKGLKTDAAFTMIVGQDPAGAKKHLINTTQRSLFAGIDAIKGAGSRTGDISAAIERVLAGGKLGIIRELVGHGIGHEMHEGPDIPNYGRPGSGALLVPGMTIAIEPMATLGGDKIKTESDGWTITTTDGSLAAHFEHTVLITETGAEILTIL